MEPMLKAHKIHVNDVETKGIEIEQIAAGTGYTVGDVFTIDSLAHMDGGTTDLGVDVTFTLASLGAERKTSTGQTNNVYEIAKDGYTSSSGGTDATFTVAVDGDGTASTVVVTAGGSGFEPGSTITVPDANIGGGGALI